MRIVWGPAERADSPAGPSVTLFDRDTAEGLRAEPGRIDAVYAVADPGTTQARLRHDVAAALAGTEVEVATGERLVADAQANSQDTFTLAVAVVPAAWAGRRRILAAVADR